MPWYEITLSIEQLDAGVSEKIQRDFEAIFIDAGSPPGMALFCDSFPVPQYSIYLSPDSVEHASDIISAYSGDPCDQPNASEVALLVGDRDSAWDLLE